MSPLALQSYRQRLGLSQEALAMLLGVHKLTISHWETGVAAAPGYLPLALAAINRATGATNPPQRPVRSQQGE
jgi:transcriptional regulator with XRE-family HTH domain